MLVACVPRTARANDSEEAMNTPSSLGFGLHPQQEQQQVSLETALAFIQDCAFDSDDDDDDDNNDDDSVGNHSLNITGRHPSPQHSSFQQLLQGHATTEYPQAAAFGHSAGSGSSPVLHGSNSGTSDSEQTQVAPAYHSSSTTGGTATARRAGKARATAKSSSARATGKKGASVLKDTELDKRFRGRRKEELLYLRKKVEEFQNQLNQMKTAARMRSATEGSESPGNGDTHGSKSDGSHSPSMWEMLAMRQSEERQKAEEVNAKLKAALEKQIRMAKSLEKILRKRTNASVRPTNSIHQPVLQSHAQTKYAI